jgi:hypothetical protein
MNQKLVQEAFQDELEKIAATPRGNILTQLRKRSGHSVKKFDSDFALFLKNQPGGYNELRAELKEDKEYDKLLKRSKREIY